MTQEEFDLDMDDDFRRQARNILEALVNLNYLIGEESKQPGKVRRYASMSEERLDAMARLLKINFRGDDGRPISL